MIKKLLDTFAPNNYSLSLSIDPEELHFTGKVSVTGEVLGRQLRGPASYKRRIVSNFLDDNPNINVPINIIVQKFSYLFCFLAEFTQNKIPTKKTGKDIKEKVITSL